MKRNHGVLGVLTHNLQTSFPWRRPGHDLFPGDRPATPCRRIACASAVALPCASADAHSRSVTTCGTAIQLGPGALLSLLVPQTLALAVGDRRPARESWSSHLSGCRLHSLRAGSKETTTTDFQNAQSKR